MREQLEQIQAEALADINASDSVTALDTVRIKVLGKKGSLTALLRSMSGLSPEERPAAGQMVNAAREVIESALDAKLATLRDADKRSRLESEAIDVTIPSAIGMPGTKLAITHTTERIIEIFTGLGFSVEEGPEIETDRFNFEMMNIPKEHPARDMHDTLYISDNLLLRTHTSPVQARTMLKRQPPIRIVCPGRVYRADEADATHSPVFHQFEGLMVDEGVNMGHLKGTLDAFAEAYFGAGIHTRFRPSFFPFTEPSVEVDVMCAACMGKGCRVCKGTGWLEILGAGMVNPKVLEMCGIDSERYTGFAFGMGLDRVTNLKYNVSDGRVMFENDINLLKQFRIGGLG